MRGEFLGVWSETWREIWQPLMDQPFGEDDESLRADIFCELYREFARAQVRPAEAEAVKLLVEDTIALKDVFEDAVRSANGTVELEQVTYAFDRSGAEQAESADKRKSLAEAALTTLLGESVERLLDEQLQEHAHDDARVKSAWNRKVERTINDAEASREAFEKVTAESLVGELAIVSFLESVQGILEGFEDSGDDTLTNRYFNLLTCFIEKYSLRYDLRRPCTLCPTLPGVFASLMRDLRTITSQDAHLDGLMKDFEESIRDLRIDYSDRRIKTSIQKQVNLLEALGRTYPGIRRKTLGAISGQLKNWPHADVMQALQSMYAFTCDYPGIRHGGTPTSALRPVDMRDMVAVSILLAGFTPYLAHGINAEVVYRRM